MIVSTVAENGERLLALKTPKRICNNTYLLDDLTETIYISCGKDKEDMHYTVFIRYDELELNKSIVLK